MSKEKDNLISLLVRLDVGIYRRMGLLEDNKYKREPTGYRTALMNIYSKLDIGELKKLVELKTQN